MEPTIFIMVRGGVVQGVRVRGLPSDSDVVVLDFDNEELDDDDVVFRFSPFNTVKELEEKTDAIY